MSYTGYRLCISEGCTTRVYSSGVFCAKCYAATPEGRRQKQAAENRRRYELQEQRRLEQGLPAPERHCTRCLHWDYGCSLGFPEGMGSFAEDCAVFTVTAVDFDQETNHPDIQQMVQDRLERAYELAGRSDPSHPQHSLFTNVFGELSAKGIAI